MRCHDAKLLLAARRNGDLSQEDTPALQEHVQQCPTCRAFERRQSKVDSLFRDAAPFVPCTISTDRIMHAIQQQQRITQQLEDLRGQQRSRMARVGIFGTAFIATTVFMLSCLPLLAFVLLLTQPGLADKALALLSDIIDILLVLGQYIQTGLALVTYNNWLLLGVAFAVVVMFGLWLRLMRYPQEA
jgi:predicted anti-sigma-YlaC factor YlaD